MSIRLFRATDRAFERAHALRRPMDADGNVIGADPVHLVGTAGVAVLLLHGFNDTPQSMGYLARRLHAVVRSHHTWSPRGLLEADPIGRDRALRGYERLRGRLEASLERRTRRLFGTREPTERRPASISG